MTCFNFPPPRKVVLPQNDYLDRSNSNMCTLKSPIGITVNDDSFLCDGMPEIWSTVFRLKWIWNNPDIILWMLKITGSSYLSESILLSLRFCRWSSKQGEYYTSVFCEWSSSRGSISRLFMCLCALVFWKDCTADQIAWFLYRIKSYLWHVLDCHGITFCCFWLLYFLLDWFFCTFIVQMVESFSILHHFHRNCPFMDLIHI